MISPLRFGGSDLNSWRTAVESTAQERAQAEEQRQAEAKVQQAQQDEMDVRQNRAFLEQPFLTVKANGQPFEFDGRSLLQMLQGLEERQRRERTIRFKKATRVVFERLFQQFRLDEPGLELLSLVKDGVLRGEKEISSKKLDRLQANTKRRKAEMLEVFQDKAWQAYKLGFIWVDFYSQKNSDCYYSTVNISEKGRKALEILPKETASGDFYTFKK